MLPHIDVKQSNDVSYTNHTINTLIIDIIWETLKSRISYL